jgi:hypothetical protein
VTQSEIESLYEGGVEGAGEAESHEPLGEMRQVTEAHEAFDQAEFAAATFF